MLKIFGEKIKKNYLFFVKFSIEMSLSIGLLGFERSFDILFRACESTTENDALCT